MRETAAQRLTKIAKVSAGEDASVSYKRLVGFFLTIPNGWEGHIGYTEAAARENLSLKKLLSTGKIKGKTP